MTQIYTPSKEPTWNVLVFEFQKENTAGSAVKLLNNAYGNDVVNEKTCRRKGDFSLQEAKEGHPKGHNS